ncbi:SPOR domain-containing protein [Daejeonella sp.]|uniref:SPOR domain-containing protein n=1 Tax=Daejeonella sp. TaxID=2805397 RepID=UPI003982D9F8
MGKKLIIGLLLSLFLAQYAEAQEKGRVIVIKDPQIDSLIAKRLALSRASTSGNSVTILGFRVQIFSGLAREDAYIVQTKFKSLYPNITSYVSYTQPNYRVRVGDFRTMLEAQKFMNSLQKQYSSLFIFAERINPR